MRHLLTTAALVAALGASAISVSQGSAQPAGDLERAVEDALGGAAEPTADETALVTPAEDPPFTVEEIDTIVAPYALYPDALLAQILVASTFPLQLVKADRLIDTMPTMSEEETSAAVEAEDWDPSVLVLMTGFPTVVQRMADNLDETEDLGLAMAEQDQDVLASIQWLREQAQDTGYLTSNAAQLVEQDGDQIRIRPANPDVVYVPNYDASAAFTSPATAAPLIVPPAANGFSSALSNPLVAGAIGFGAGLLVSEFFGNQDDDSDSEGWDDYWRRSRPIDWNDRQVYPRPFFVSAGPGAAARREIAWSQERDRYWDRQAEAWRREANEARRSAWDARRDARGWEVRRDSDTGGVFLRPRDWQAVEPRFIVENPDNARDPRARVPQESERAAAAPVREAEGQAVHRPGRDQAIERNESERRQALERSQREQATRPQRARPSQQREPEPQAERDRSRRAEPAPQAQREQTHRAEPAPQQRESGRQPEREQTRQAEPERQQRRQAQQPQREQPRQAEPEQQQRRQAEQPEREQPRQAEPERQQRRQAEQPEREQARQAEPERQQRRQAEQPEREQARQAEPERQRRQAVEPEREQTRRAEPDRQRREAEQPQREQARRAEPDRQQREAEQPQREQKRRAEPKPEAPRQAAEPQPEREQARRAEPDRQRQRQAAEPQREQVRSAEPRPEPPRQAAEPQQREQPGDRQGARQANQKRQSNCKEGDEAQQRACRRQNN